MQNEGWPEIGSRWRNTRNHSTYVVTEHIVTATGARIVKFRFDGRTRDHFLGLAEWHIRMEKENG